MKCFSKNLDFTTLHYNLGKGLVGNELGKSKLLRKS